MHLFLLTNGCSVDFNVFRPTFGFRFGKTRAGRNKNDQFRSLLGRCRPVLDHDNCTALPSSFANILNSSGSEDGKIDWLKTVCRTQTVYLYTHSHCGQVRKKIQCHQQRPRCQSHCVQLTAATAILERVFSHWLCLAMISCLCCLDSICTWRCAA